MLAEQNPREGRARALSGCSGPSEGSGGEGRGLERRRGASSSVCVFSGTRGGRLAPLSLLSRAFLPVVFGDEGAGLQAALPLREGEGNWASFRNSGELTNRGYESRCISV